MRIGEFKNLFFANLKKLFENQRPFMKFQTINRGALRNCYLPNKGKTLMKEKRKDYNLSLMNNKISKTLKVRLEKQTVIKQGFLEPT